MKKWFSYLCNFISLPLFFHNLWYHIGITRAWFNLGCGLIYHSGPTWAWLNLSGCHAPLKILHIFSWICDFIGDLELTDIPLEMGLARMENGMFKCLVCTRSFQHNSTAKRHYKEKHLQGLQCHKCSYCGKEYTLLRYLKEHMSNVHQITQKMLNSRFLPPNLNPL